MLKFTAKDVFGREVTEKDYSGAKLIMINFWEPWCGPCVGEIADLQKLYDNYKDKGLVILGMFSTADMTDRAKMIITMNRVTYPILHFTEELRNYTTQYVPTTVFFDGQGNLLSPEPAVGSKSYEGWKAEVEKYLA